MTRARCTAAGLVLLLCLAGCARDSPQGPAPTSSTEGDTSMTNDLTWQQAKARTQAMELEIANFLPQDIVEKIDQAATGILINCENPLVNWHGATTVTLSAETEPEALVREIEAEYRDSRFNIKTRTAPAGHYEVQLRSPDTEEIYLVAEGLDPNTIRIASGSECFVLPEEEFIGGDF